MQLALLSILAIADHLQIFSNWSPGFNTGIATLSWIVLLVLLVGIELVSSSTRVTSVKFHKPLVSFRQPDP